jgi:hypothetical protein
MEFRLRLGIAFATLGLTGGVARAERGTLFKTVRPLIAQMASDIRYEERTPDLEVVSIDGAVRLQKWAAPSRPEGGIPRYEIEGLRAGAPLRLLALLPVSGQVGWESAKAFARNNRYTLLIEHADGRREFLRNVAAQGLVTQKQLSLAIKPGKTVISFWTDNTDGAIDERAGRAIELHYTPTN